MIAVDSSTRRSSKFGIAGQGGETIVDDHE